MTKVISDFVLRALSIASNRMRPKKSTFNRKGPIYCKISQKSLMNLYLKTANILRLSHLSEKLWPIEMAKLAH